MVRCGLIGCGRVVEEMHLPALRALRNVSVEAVCDTNLERLQEFAACHNIPKVSASLKAFLDENQELDFVVVGTPGYTHYELAMQLVEAKTHMFVEKPLALNMAQSLYLKKKAQEFGVKVCVAQTWRYRDPVMKAWRALHEGLVGKVYQVNVTHHAGSLFHCSVPEWAWKEREHKVLVYEHSLHMLDMQVCFAGPVRKILSIRVIKSPELNLTTRIYALVEHESGAIGIVDLQQFASSNFTQIEIFGTANDVQIKFFPHSYRLYSGRVNPADELWYEFLRIRDFVWPVLKAKICPPSIPRKVLPHYRILGQFVQALSGDSVPVPVTIDDVLPTMDYLEQLSQAVYE